MPNHIQNVLRISAYEFKGCPPTLIDEILAAIKSEQLPMDFGRIIPMPEGLNIESGSRADCARALFDDAEAQKIGSYPWASQCRTLGEIRELLRTKYLQSPQEGFPRLDDLSARIRENLDKYGAQTWYDWSIEHWGTKWNAYSAVAGKLDDQAAVVCFETAWSPPMPVLDALAAKFPTADIRLIWCDEGDDRQHRVYWADGKRDANDEAAAA